MAGRVMEMMLMCHDGDVLQCNGRALNIMRKDPKSSGMVKYYMVHCYFNSYHRLSYILDKRWIGIFFKYSYVTE